MKKTALIIIPAIFLLNACALEIANVIGPGGGWVFYDKGNYDGGWRYIECSSFDFGELNDGGAESVIRAMELCSSHSGGWYSFPWELPDEAQMKKMLECFTYGLTKFSPDFYYLAVNKKAGYDLVDLGDPGTWNADAWEAVALHKDFGSKLNGEVEKAADFPDLVKVRAIRKF